MRRIALLMVVAGLLLTGCEASNESIVSGKVTIDGQPLREGEIIFEAVDQDSTPEGTNIVDGKYQLTIAAGKKLVRINASRPTKIPDPLMGEAARESMIEPEFNVNSKLTVELQPGVQADVDFQVRSIP